MLRTRVDWSAGLPRPLAFVLSGGAGLGAIQVGMVQALAEVGLEPDLVVGTSVGALNGAAVAEHASLADAGAVLDATWRGIRRASVFPGSRATQALSALRTGHLHPRDGLDRLVRETIAATRFEHLARPLTVVAAEVLTGHVRTLVAGELRPALLAATALPGLFAPVEVAGEVLWDGGAVANVPLREALAVGAASLVVLDAGDVCHRELPPQSVPDAMLTFWSRAVRQRVQVEAPIVGAQVPLLYLPRPCVSRNSILDLDTSFELIEPTRRMVARFLAESDLPTIDAICGAPHHHPLREAEPAQRPATDKLLPRVRALGLSGVDESGADAVRAERDSR